MSNVIRTLAKPQQASTGSELVNVQPCRNQPHQHIPRNHTEVRAFGPDVESSHFDSDIVLRMRTIVW